MNNSSKLKELWVCPNCGTEMNLIEKDNSSYYVCPECGCTIDSEKQNFDIDSICPNCNQVLEGNECSYCGYDLGSDFD